MAIIFDRHVLPNFPLLQFQWQFSGFITYRTKLLNVDWFVTDRAKLLNANWFRQRAFFLNFAPMKGKITRS